MNLKKIFDNRTINQKHIGNVFIDDIVKTESFKKWFGSSKVVDDNGKPLVLFHGSISKFDTFKNDIIFHSNSRRVCSFFGDYDAYELVDIERYYKYYNAVKESNDIGDLLDVYNIVNDNHDEFKVELLELDWGNMYRLDDIDGVSSSPIGKTESDAIIYLKKEIERLLDRYRTKLDNPNDFNGVLYRDFLRIENPYVMDFCGKMFDEDEGIFVHIQEAFDNGYDGAIIKNVREGTIGRGVLCDDYLTFSPNQIKSIQNNGNFSTNDDNIYK